MELSAETRKDISTRMLGNQNAAKPMRLVSDMLRRIALQEPEKLRKACRKLYAKASAGDVQAFRELADRIEGKVIQQVSVNSTTTVIDADLLSEAGKLLQIIAGQPLEQPLEGLSETVDADTDTARVLHGESRTADHILSSPAVHVLTDE